MVLVLMLCSANGAGAAIDEDVLGLETDSVSHLNDTVYFYDSWQHMLEKQPAMMFAYPDAEVYSIEEIYIRADLDSINDIIENLYIALSVGDSIWLINSDYLKRNFKVDYNNIQRYNPLFFTNKAAFMCTYAPVTLQELIDGEIDDGQETVAYYYIDFMNRKVERVTHKYMSRLLEDYHDLKMRYEGMKDFKKPYVIEDYLFMYIDRASEDFMRPSIPELITATPNNKLANK